MSNVSDVRKTGRPRIDAVPVTVRIPPDQLAALDAWIVHKGGEISRPEAIRALLAEMLNPAAFPNQVQIDSKP